MHYFRKLIFIIAVSAIADTAMAKINVLACEPEWASLVKELTGKHAKVFSATTGLQDPHHIQARPSLLAKARRADLLICTGAELEIGWLPILLRKTANPKIQMAQPGYLMAADHLELKDKGMQRDRSEGDVHAAGNPHVQMNPHNISVIAKVMLERLQKIDAENASIYQQNYQNFMQRWQTAIVKWEEQAKPLQGQSIVVYHKSWIYMTDWLGLKVVAVIEPKAGIPPSSTHLSNIINQMEAQPAEMIIHASHQPAKASEWLSTKTGIKKIQLPFTVGGSTGAKDLFSMFDETIQLMLSVKR